MVDLELRVLFVEDSQEDAELEERELRRQGLRITSLRVETREELLRAIGGFKPEVIICDYSLPGMDGLSALRLVRDNLPEVPFIFVSGTIGEDRAVGSLKAGATDYVGKDRIGKLPHAVTRALKEVQERVERQTLESQLRQAQKMEAFGQLAGGIAHDFNNLLTAIIGGAYLARIDLPSDHPSQRELDEIDKAGNRAAALTKQLLAFSRKQVLQPRVLDLNVIVADMAKMLRRVIGEHVEFSHKLQEAIGRVKADPSQIEQVILNLAVNARDAMPKGGRLIIETRDVDLDEEYSRSHPDCRPGQYVMLAVSDTGVGMDEKTQSRIFEPFFTTKGQGKGTGLGLATVFGIIKQSQGHISVYSEPGRGSTFKVYFPRVDEEAQLYKSWIHRALPKGGSERILVVEDEEPVRNLICNVLKSVGYRVIVARNAIEALTAHLASSEPIHLMITDLVMPGMSGGQLAAKMRVTNPGMKILHMSGYTQDAVINQGELKEDTPFLPKPFTPENLLRTVRETLDASPGVIRPFSEPI